MAIIDAALFLLDGFFERKAPKIVYRATLSIPCEISSTGFRQPYCHGFSALDLWLCVSAFQRVCPFTLYSYPILYDYLKFC